MNGTSIMRTAILLLTFIGLGWNVHAQISVKTNGSGTITFNSQPTMAQGWSTLSVGVNSSSFGNIASLEGAVQSLLATDVNQPVGSTFSTSPPASASTALWNGTLFRLQTRPTLNGLVALRATMRNDTSNRVDRISVSYSYIVDPNAIPEEEVPGHRAFYSLSGLPNTWLPIPQFSGLTVS